MIRVVSEEGLNKIFLFVSASTFGSLTQSDRHKHKIATKHTEEAHTQGEEV